MKLATTLCGLLLFIGSASFATDVVNVVDENQRPIANASVLLGYDAGNPFPGNSFSTDASGVAAIPSGWKAALPVTVQASGFITTTIPVAMPGQLTIQLTHQESDAQIEIKGTASGFGHLVDDGRVHFGLLIPAINRSQLLAFDMSSIISPQVDTINVLGQSIDIPSNISLPDQTVTYIFPIKINKPDYRSYVRTVGQYLMTATHGSFPLQKVVNDIRAGKSIFEEINYLTLVEGGQQSVDVQGNVAGVDIAVNQTQFTNQLSVQAPTFPTNQVMLSLALNEQNGIMLLTDLKRLTPGQSMNLKYAGSAPSVLSLLLVNSNPIVNGINAQAMRELEPINFSAPLTNNSVPAVSATQSFAQLSFAFLPAAGGVAPQFLPLIDKPSLDATNVLHMSVPATIPSGLTPVATYMVFTEIQTLGTGKVKSEQRIRLWEVWSTSWLGQLELPKINFARNPNRKYRWEVMFLAQPVGFTGGSVRTNGVDLKSVTHVTRNTLDL